MINLGIDFDNTLITYDSIFRKVAIEKNLIPSDFPEDKKLIRNFLRKKEKEDLFTLLQGEVYGARVSEAKKSRGMFDVLKKANKTNINLFIVSHKTKTPYLGPKYDLHNAAKSWLEKNLFFEKKGINMSRENVYFEVTKQKKIERIKSIGCTHFIDDLPEILDLIDSNIKKILYSPLDNNNNNMTDQNLFIMKDWSELDNFII